MSKVVHFEIGSVDEEKVKKFYEDVFGWQFKSWGGPQSYYLITTGGDSKPGINGGMFKSKGEAVVVNTIDVDNLDEMIEKVKTGGGTIEVPKMAIPGIGWLCYFKDVEGNLFGMMQNDPGAK